MGEVYAFEHTPASGRVQDVLFGLIFQVRRSDRPGGSAGPFRFCMLVDGITHLMHDAAMRTTLAIDDDVLAAAKAVAERDNKSLGEVISSLARRGLQPKATALRRTRNGVPLLRKRPGGGPVTPELVNRLRDELP